MHSDLRGTGLYREAEALYTAVRRPGSGQIADATEIHASPSGEQAMFAATLAEKLEGASPTRICHVDLLSGDTRVLTFGPHSDRLPKYSPDGRLVAFLSDRQKVGDFQLHILSPATGAARGTPPVDGWVEYLQWSPDGRRLLLGVAGHGADIAGGQGAVTSQRVSDRLPSWMPRVESGDESFRWRAVWIYELEGDRIRRVSRPGCNVWEAAWCGNDTLVVVASTGPGEGLWYSARLEVVQLSAGESRELYVPKDQLGWPSASPSGGHVAVVEAICSDRWIVAGDLRVIEMDSGKVHSIDCHAADITYTEWRSNRLLLLAGHRGFETVVGVYDVVSQKFNETWSSHELSISGRYASVAGFGTGGDCVLIGESFVTAPEIAVIRSREYKAIRSFDLGYFDYAQSIAAVERVVWAAPDGLEIQGWLLKPTGSGPHPLILNIHGGPVWLWRPLWLGRGGASSLMLLKRGCAILFPNPRGSSGRGREFARRVVGDMGGADTYDYISGIDHLINQGAVDPNRLGAIGTSYGGFMTSWLITQDSRFAAAVPVCPITNQITEYLLSNIPHFVSLFLADAYNNPLGKYWERSPVMHAHKVKTPTLNICGTLDRCTPPEEAQQFHQALMESGVESVLVTYPEEGHGIRNCPAAIDYAARVVGWFEEHMGLG